MDLDFPRRHFLRLAASIAAVPGFARADAYPARPVRIVVGFPAGTSSDITARLIGQSLSERTGQQFLVENRPGAGTNIATEEVVHAPPDGYSLLWVTQTNAINVTLYDHLNFNFSRDIAPVAGIIRVPAAMLVTSSLPAKTVPEFIAYAKANPGKINMATAGIGTTPHMSGALFEQMAGVDLVTVAYRGGAPALIDLIAGQVQMMFEPTISTLEYVKTGKLRALGVTSATRSEQLPDVPAISEFVPGYEATQWYGIGAPRNTPADVIAKLNKEINAALADPKLKGRLTDLGGIVTPTTPAELGKLVADETEKWAKVVRAANLKAE
jgi:tripartite-type tricarboxylate transporter receptor subunit TctC